MRVVAPAHPWRIIRGEAANYKVIDYSTKERRDAAAARFAAQDGDQVLTELWDASHPQDSLNRGWACDGVVHPPHDARPDDNPEPGDRCKDCGKPITWLGPSHLDWLHVDDPANQPV